MRDRDRLRQQILEARGWHIHRIWSTDWFQRPEEQINRVMDALSTAKKYWDEVDRCAAESASILSERLIRGDEDDSSLWTRVDCANEDTILEEAADTYTEAVFTVTGFSGSPINLNQQQLQSLIARALEVEAPIHADEIGRRLIKILAEGRLVASFRKKIDAAVVLLVNQNLAERRGEFVYRNGQVDFPVRARRALENANLRKPEYIAPEELRSAIVRVITESIGTDVSETVASAAKLLGINNGQMAQELLGQEIDALKSESAVIDRDGKLFVSV